MGETSTLMTTAPAKPINPSDGLEYLLTHFSSPDSPEPEPSYPRPVSTVLTETKQRDVYSLDVVKTYFEAADWIDAKIGAYPKYDLLAQKGKIPWGYVPTNWVLFIDQEHGDIKTTLHNIKMLLNGGTPTVLWSGHGYHIYMPLRVTTKDILVNRELAIQYMRFMERKVSGQQCDKGHYPSFNSCMLRIPGSYNHGCILEGVDSEVKLLQKWDGFRISPSQRMLDEFIAAQNRLKLKQLHREREEIELIKKYGSKEAANAALKDPLTEFLIFHSSGIADGRKNILYYIIARYLVKVKGVDRATAEGIMADWCRRCQALSKIRCTSQYLRYHIRHCVSDAIYKHENPYPVSYIQTLAGGKENNNGTLEYQRLLKEYEEFTRNKPQQ